jgi:predicted transcriptional regulator
MAELTFITAEDAMILGVGKAFPEVAKNYAKHLSEVARELPLGKSLLKQAGEQKPQRKSARQPARG